jgi:hypothetical protein
MDPFFLLLRMTVPFISTQVSRHIADANDPLPAVPCRVFPSPPIPGETKFINKSDPQKD